MENQREEKNKWKEQKGLNKKKHAILKEKMNY